MKTCTQCKLELPDDHYYERKTRPSTLSQCKECLKKATVVRQQEFKRKCVDYKGGQCERCGYNTYIGALEFHHLDPTKKDFSISKQRATSFEKNREKITAELDKCMLLCANCHREIHGGLG